MIDSLRLSALGSALGRQAGPYCAGLWMIRNWSESLGLLKS